MPQNNRYKLKPKNTTLKLNYYTRRDIEIKPENKVQQNQTTPKKVVLDLICYTMYLFPHLKSLLSKHQTRKNPLCIVSKTRK